MEQSKRQQSGYVRNTYSSFKSSHPKKPAQTARQPGIPRPLDSLFMLRRSRNRLAEAVGPTFPMPSSRAYLYTIATPKKPYIPFEDGQQSLSGTLHNQKAGPQFQPTGCSSANKVIIRPGPDNSFHISTEAQTSPRAGTKRSCKGDLGTRVVYGELPERGVTPFPSFQQDGGNKLYSEESDKHMIITELSDYWCDMTKKNVSIEDVERLNTDQINEGVEYTQGGVGIKSANSPKRMPIRKPLIAAINYSAAADSGHKPEGVVAAPNCSNAVKIAGKQPEKQLSIFTIPSKKPIKLDMKKAMKESSNSRVEAESKSYRRFEYSHAAKLSIETESFRADTLVSDKISTPKVSRRPSLHSPSVLEWQSRTTCIGQWNNNPLNHKVQIQTQCIESYLYCCSGARSATHASVPSRCVIM